jgi:hypothetical protein
MCIKPPLLHHHCVLNPSLPPSCNPTLVTLFPYSPVPQFVRTCVNSTASSAKHRLGSERYLNPQGEFFLPLFALPKSLDALFALMLHALMNASPTVREEAAEAIGELALLADLPVLKPLLIKTTGPLIRVVGDRHPR